MARAPQSTDFSVDIDGIGTFTFARRRMADELKIQVEYARILDGVKPTEWLDLIAGWKSVLKVLTVRAPEDWGVDIFGNPTSDIDEMDPQDPVVYERLGLVNMKLAEKERSFRPRNGEASERSGQGAITGD